MIKQFGIDANAAVFIQISIPISICTQSVNVAYTNREREMKFQTPIMRINFSIQLRRLIETIYA